MALVDYSDSGSDTGNDGEEKIGVQNVLPEPRPSTIEIKPAIHNTVHDVVDRKRKTSSHLEESPDPTSLLPPLPSTFHSLYASNVRISNQDYPALHLGRTRQTPHIEGNWPTHVYLEWYPHLSELNSLRALIQSVRRTLNATEESDDTRSVHSLLETELGAQLPLHISLSSPISLQTEQRSAFLDDIKTEIKDLVIQTFKTKTTGFKWVSNSDRTRWFLVLNLDTMAGDSLHKLLALCNKASQWLGQPSLYDTDADTQSGSREEAKQAKRRKNDTQDIRSRGPDFADRSGCFHISIAWTLQDPSEVCLPPNVDTDGISIHFEDVKIKIGNVVHEVPLTGSSSSSRPS